MKRDGGEQKSDQPQQAEKAFQPADFQYRILVTHNLAHLDPRPIMFRIFGAPGSFDAFEPRPDGRDIEWRPCGPWINFHFTSNLSFNPATVTSNSPGSTTG